MFTPSPVHEMIFEQKRIYVKRDDLLHADFSGNKARKFHYFLSHDFSPVTQLVASGSAQANSLYSLSVLAKQRGWQCDYYVSHLNQHLINHPQGNYAAALANGTRIIDISQLSLAEQYKSKHLDEVMEHIVAQHYQNNASVLHIPEGGRCGYAEFGLSFLAAEIIDWVITNNKKNLAVFLPSGTGTTAAYLSKQLKLQLPKKLSQRFTGPHNACSENVNIEVLTCSTVGGDDYLLKQFSSLIDQVYFPRVLNDGHKYHFGKLTKRCFDMWKSICSQGIEFELVYDPVGFLVLKAFLASNPQWQGDILYLHQGGVLGNQSMLSRYQRKFGCD
ncbi:1-aminocyclopropane-1-carboxylate deaminase/D-cysteine desulfhydrase [Shewanella sp.]|uniref:1-aminocyclopropane-1-carboxylate deaminase/D-cysteine desulfhydrase n=1 Tax=Shewanella sp. TaxID=50422 RepID=UPI004048DF42